MTKRGMALVTAALMFLLAAIPVFGTDVPYPDVSPDHWAYEAIVRLHNAGLIEGYPDGTFGGERTFTRYEMAMVFDRILKRLDVRMESLAKLGIDVDAITEEFGPEFSLIDALAGAVADARSAVAEARDLAEAAAQSADTAGDRAYHARLTAEQALAQAKKANETATIAAALAGGDAADESGLSGAALEEVRRAAQRAQRVAADAEAAAMRANAVAEMALAASDNSLEAAVEETRLAAQRAQRIAADAEAAALKAQAMADLALTTGDAEVALEEVELATDRAYRARLTAEQALALGRQADEKASRALAMGEIAMKDTAAVAETAQQALDTALQADRLAYLAHLSAERALDTAENALGKADDALDLAGDARDTALQADRLAYLAHLSAERALDEAENANERIDGTEGRVGNLEGRFATMPKLSGELSANYEGTHTSTQDPDDDFNIDPRDPDSDTLAHGSDIKVGVLLKAVVEPKDDVRVEGGIKFSSSVFSGLGANVGLSNLYAQVTTPGLLRKAYFGSLSKANVAKGFNKFSLDGPRYEKVVTTAAGRGGAFAEFEAGKLSTRVLASKTDAADLLWGINSTLALSVGMNVGVSYTAKNPTSPILGLNAYGETGALTYDWAFGRFKDEATLDGSISATFGDVALGFAHRSIGSTFVAGDPDYLGKVYDDDDDGIVAGRKDHELTLNAPVLGLDVEYVKGYDALLDGTDFTDSHKIGFTDANLLGFDLSAHYYMDTTDKPAPDAATMAYRVGIDRTVNLGLPLTFSFVQANIGLVNYTGVANPAAWTSKAHQAFGVALKEYELSETLTVDAGYKVERNAVGSNWTAASNWDVAIRDDNTPAPGAPWARVKDRATMHARADLDLAEGLTVFGGYERVDNDTNLGKVVVGTTDLGAGYKFGLFTGQVRLGYAWQNVGKQGPAGFVYADSPRSTYAVSYEQPAWGGTLDTGYKFVTGRGSDGPEKLNAKDTVAHLDYKYPVAEGMDFTLGGKWTNSVDNDPVVDDYYIASVKAGFAVKF